VLASLPWWLVAWPVWRHCKEALEVPLAGESTVPPPPAAPLLLLLLLLLT